MLLARDRSLSADKTATHAIRPLLFHYGDSPLVLRIIIVRREGANEITASCKWKQLKLHIFPCEYESRCQSTFCEFLRVDNKVCSVLTLSYLQSFVVPLFRVDASLLLSENLEFPWNNPPYRNSLFNTFKSGYSQFICICMCIGINTCIRINAPQFIGDLRMKVWKLIEKCTNWEIQIKKLDSHQGGHSIVTR